MNIEYEDSLIYVVVVNYEEQYFIWFEYKDILLGWIDVGKYGIKVECLEYIKEVWMDMCLFLFCKVMEVVF